MNTYCYYPAVKKKKVEVAWSHIEKWWHTASASR